MVRSNIYHCAVVRLYTRKFCFKSGLNLETLLVRNSKRRQVSTIRIEAMMRRREKDQFASRERGEMYKTEIVKISTEKSIQ